MIGTDNRNAQQLRRRVAWVLSSARPNCTYVRKNPLLAVRMVVLEFDLVWCTVCAKLMRRGLHDGEQS